MTRVSPGSNTIEIFSRPRLSHVAWLLHCRGKIVHGNAAQEIMSPVAPASGQTISHEEIYRIADGSGLHYGPTFQLVEHVVMHDDKHMTVQLSVPATQETSFALDPMRLDCSTHGLFTVFPELRVEERGVTYIPVRLDEAALYRPGALPEKAYIEITVKSERSILANYYLFGPDNEIIAVLRGVRCQAVPVRRAAALESIALMELPQLFDGTICGKTGVAATARDVLAKAQAMEAIPEELAANESTMLVEGWATAAAYEIASGLAEGLVVDVDLLVASGRVPEEMRPWLTKLMLNLEAAELANQEEGAWVLIRDPSLPSSASVIKALSSEYPERAAEVLLAGAVTSFAEHIGENRAIRLQPDSIIPKAALEFYDTTNVALTEAERRLLAAPARHHGSLARRPGHPRPANRLRAADACSDRAGGIPQPPAHTAGAGAAPLRARRAATSAERRCDAVECRAKGQARDLRSGRFRRGTSSSAVRPWACRAERHAGRRRPRDRRRIAAFAIQGPGIRA